MITDEQVETALRKWFKDEVTWDKGMAPWTAVQFRVEMRATLEAALTLPSAGEVEALASPSASEAQVRVKDECQYAKDVSMPEHRCAVRCQYEQKVRAKPLEWQEQENSSGETSYWGHHQFGCYAIDRDYFSTVPWELVSGGRVVGNFDTVEQAKSAAQADYERRILSALSTPEQVETPPSPSQHVRGDEAEWIKTCTAKISNAIGGGSELFTRHGAEFRLDIDFVCKRISEQRERMIAALGNAVRAQRKADGIELSARFVETRRDDYVKEFGFYDGETGVTEFPGNGNEYVYELDEIIEGIRALASEGEANG